MVTTENNPHETVRQFRDQVVLAALELAEQQSWAHVGFADIAERSGYSLAELRISFDDKSDILAALGRMIDAQMLEGCASPDPSMSTKDVLFDLFMDRFDILNGYRGGICAILQGFREDPKQAVISCPHLCRSMSWMLEAAHVNVSGFRGAAKVMGMSVLYIKVLRVWMHDESPDLSKTMAALDKALGRAEQFANSFGL